MEGFWTTKQTESKTRPDGKALTCISCGLSKQCKNPNIKPYGNFKKKVLIIGEAPGCISGDSLIEVAFRDKSIYPDGIPIQELVGKDNFYVYSYDTTKNDLAIGRVNRVWRTGKKGVFKVTYEWRHRVDGVYQTVRNSIKVTSNHLFLIKKIYHLKDTYKGIEEKRTYVSLDSGLSLGHSLQPFHRAHADYDFIGAFSKSIVQESRFLLEYKLKRKIIRRKEQCHHKNLNKSDDSWENLTLLSIIEHGRYHGLLNNAMHNPVVKEKHAKIMSSPGYKKTLSDAMKNALKDPVKYKKHIETIHKNKQHTSETLKRKYQDPEFYYKYLLSRKESLNWSDTKIEKRFKNKFPQHNYPPIDNHKVVSIEYVGEEDVYDMEVETYHNFAVNNIFVHNSTEDARGKPWQGRTGKLLHRVCKELKIDLFDDCLSMNAVNCRPIDKEGNNQSPTNYEMDCCRRSILQTIEQYKPKLIIPLGTAAVYSLIGHRWKKDLGTISKWRGWTIPDQDFQTWICPTFHPSYVERSDNGPELTVWVLDLKRAFEMLTKPFLKHVEPRIDIIEDLYMLANITNPEIAFDYETTGLKPHAEGHRIICCAVAPSESHAYVFMMPKTKAGRKPLIDLLINPKIGKIAHNMKYEHAWSLVRLKTEVQNWIWDTMLASHILDSRAGITSLQFQVYVQFGVIDYKDETEPYLKSYGDSANDINRIQALISKPGGKEILMKRCALDAVYEFRLAQKQRENFLPF